MKDVERLIEILSTMDIPENRRPNERMMNSET